MLIVTVLAVLPFIAFTMAAVPMPLFRAAFAAMAIIVAHHGSLILLLVS